jgi:L-ascorbate metabolism protein UlaG (beta-lactamase superfamily)
MTMSEAIRLTYFDTAMVLLEVGGVRLLTDPVLDPAGTAFDYGFATLRKTSGETSPGDLGHIDAVLLSHDQHGDNLDNAGRALLSRVPLVLTTPLAAERLGRPAVGLQDWQTMDVNGKSGGSVRVTAVPAQHGPDGTQDATGPVTGFVITTSGGSKIYVSGDTVPFAGTEEIARRYAPVDLAVLHLGRAKLEALGDATLSLSAEEAVRYAEALKARRVIPAHFEGWAHFTQGRGEIRRVFDASSLGERTLWPEHGKGVVLEA